MLGPTQGVATEVFRSVALAFVACVASLLCFSPRLLVFTEEAPGSYEWTRGMNFVAQVQGQTGDGVEPALRHRLLPVFVARALGLHGYAALLLGWAGVLVCLACVNSLLRSLDVPERIAASSVFLLASTSAVVTSLGWLGIFDCWWVLALIVVAIAKQWWLVGLASLLAPWIDERFLIGLPIAFAARWLIYRLTVRDVARVGLAVLLPLLPYLVWRLYSLVYSPTDASGGFVSTHFVVWLSMVPHGWWMSYRLAWVFILLPFFVPNATGVSPLWLGLICMCAGFAAVLTAADITRSAMVFAPLMVVGVIVSFRRYPKETLQWMPWITAANFIVPYMHVVYNKLEPVHPLPWEIIRLLKKVG